MADTHNRRGRILNKLVIEHINLSIIDTDYGWLPWEDRITINGWNRVVLEEVVRQRNARITQRIRRIFNLDDSAITRRTGKDTYGSRWNEKSAKGVVIDLNITAIRDSCGCFIAAKAGILKDRARRIAENTKGRSLGERPAFLRSPPGCGVIEALGCVGRGLR